MIYFDHAFVTCLYVPFYLVGNVCTRYVAILLVYVSFLPCCIALCLFEKHMLTFVALIHALPTRWRIVFPIHNMERDAFCNKGESLCFKGEKKLDTQFRGENLSLHTFVHGELAFMLWELFLLPESCFVLCSFVDGVERFCLTLRSRHF
jgi:hypothetical protein